MNNRCSWPDCCDKPVKTINLRYTSGNPQIELCQKHYDRHLIADSCWEKIIKTEGFIETTIIFNDSSISIFREALLSYSMGLNATVVLLCRASMESAMHAYISSFNPKYDKLPNNGKALRTFDHNYACDNIRLTDLIKYLRKNNVLLNMNDKINFVKDNGDFIAHHSERFWKSWQNLNTNNIDNTTHIKLWVTDDETKKSLTYTSEVISQLITTYYTTTKS